MRLWHYRLLPYLSELQFKGQLREIVAIMHDWRDKGATNHLLINKVMEYERVELASYFFKYRSEYIKRYAKDIPLKTSAEFFDFVGQETVYPDEIFNGWHNKEYLRMNLANLAEKHFFGVGKSRITDEEWERLCEGYKQITGEEYHI